MSARFRPLATRAIAGQRAGDPPARQRAEGPFRNRQERLALELRARQS